MSDNRANSSGAIRLKQAATLLVPVGGGLGALKTVVDYTHTAIESRDILFATFFVGVTTLTFIIAFCMLYAVGAFLAISLFEWVSKRFMINTTLFTSLISSFFL
jgi:hypothetical protein